MDICVKQPVDGQLDIRLKQPTDDVLLNILFIHIYWLPILQLNVVNIFYIGY